MDLSIGLMENYFRLYAMTTGMHRRPEVIAIGFMRDLPLFLSGAKKCEKMYPEHFRILMLRNSEERITLKEVGLCTKSTHVLSKKPHLSPERVRQKEAKGLRVIRNHMTAMRARIKKNTLT